MRVAVEPDSDEVIEEADELDTEVELNTMSPSQ